jgi:hypothetical protein
MWREPVHLRIGDRTTGDFGEIVHQEKPKKVYGSCLSPAVHSLEDLVCKFIDFIDFIGDLRGSNSGQVVEPWEARELPSGGDLEIPPSLTYLKPRLHL